MYHLPARLDPIVNRFVDEALEATVARFGSPVNVVFPRVFHQNVDAFTATLTEFRQRHRIFYPHKVNQSAAFVAAARRLGAHIDVASPGELDSAVAGGFDADRIEVTGPKGLAFLQDLTDRGITVNIDNRWELETLTGLTASRPAENPLPVLVRLSGFDPPSAHRPPSRFGVDLADVPAALDVLCRPESRLRFRGVAFHLDSGDARERVRAIDAALSVVEAAYARGLSPDVLNIGGGFRQAFSADPDAYDGYVHALEEGLNGTGPALGWPGHTFGYRGGERGFRGTPAFHKYGNAAPGTALLREVLSARLRDQSVTELLRDMLLELWVEPGKALVDGAGLTIATVEFTKRLAGGLTMVNLDLSRDTVTPLDQEVMVDPLVSYRRPGPDEPCAVYFGGALCLERDLVFRHATWLPREPAPGDRIVFVNTAAYQMDLSATSAALRPPTTKVVASEEPAGGFVVVPDHAERT